MSSEAVLERLTRLHPKLIDLSLGRIETLLGRLGHPQRRLPAVVHVAGTNGKGSVIAFLRAFLEAAGHRVHVYTSPHLVRFNERIRLAGELISDIELITMLEECETANGGDPITFFEITTAAAFLAFSRHPADLLLLETGLGGRLDATSVVERPALTVLTPISVDHQRYLGDGLEKIAGEKAGILKAGVACVVASQQRKVEKVIARRAAEQGAPLIREGKDWFVRGGVVLSSGGKTRRLPPPALAGAHQVHNAGLAVACLDQLGDFAVADAAIALGMKAVQWPARLQRLAGGPLVDILPDGWELWLDGGHNAAAARALARQARRWRERPLHLIFGMLRTKDPLAFLQPLAGKVNALRAVAIPGEESSLSAEETAAAAARLGIDAAAAVEIDAALQSLVDHFPGPARVLICGSLYLAGEVLRENG